jgi:hypothetical protein
MFRYRTSYRFYTLAKVGFCAAFLWYVWDFFWIRAALTGLSADLLTPAADIVFFGIDPLDTPLRALARLLDAPTMSWAFLLGAPVAAGLFLWGRHRWLQVAVVGWISLTMVALACFAGEFISHADIWIHYVFLTYGFAAVISRPGEWEREEPGFSLSAWRANPVLTSTYAWLIVLAEFTVYFFAGLNKLIEGWVPWTSGVALQNLAYDSSMHDFVRGIAVPYWISLILCYVTLFQRLVVPFGFYLPRFRIWSVLILGSMHIGYAILMKVTIFPLIGIASLLMILPVPPAAPVAQAASRKAQKRRKNQALSPSLPSRPWWQTGLLGVFSVWLLLEPLRLTVAPSTVWENRFLVIPTWRMFADGGVSAGKEWRLILATPSGEIDATDQALGLLPHRWRDRFYMDIVLHNILDRKLGPDSLPIKLLTATESVYSERQTKAGASPVVSDAGFEIYRNHQ